MSTERLQFYSNDIDEVFSYFKSLEMLESVFGIRFAWQDGSFDSEVGECNPNLVMYKGKTYTTPLLLSVTYDDNPRYSLWDSFSRASVRVVKQKR